ncbi:hypothetical protein MOKP122_39050 [Mycobacterium avium subsp. hominissuis]
MYLVIAGTTSARAAASRRPAALAIAPWMRSTPNTVASISGTRTMASTFHRTGQLLSDHAGGRLAGTAPPPSGAGPGASAAAGSAGRLNMVTSSRPRDRPLRSALKQTRGS